jgi:hypothetical protein
MARIALVVTYLIGMAVGVYSLDAYNGSRSRSDCLSLTGRLKTTEFVETPPSK